MNKFFKGLFVLSLMFLSCFSFVACEMTMSNKENQNNVVAENVELSTATLGDVEFENAETVTLNKNENKIIISGTISAMSESQKIAFGAQDVTHAVVLKFTFDKEKTISTFEIKGKTTKVYGSGFMGCLQ